MAVFPTIKAHSERAQHQHRVVRKLRQALTEEDCTVQMDFAENWMVTYPDEVQAAYFSKEPVTLHPAVVHYKVGDELKRRSLALVTDDRKHDTGAILAFMQRICESVRTLLPNIKTIHYASDSPSSQYRNKTIFSILCKHQALFDGIRATWTYFEAGHGKGPCDGVGAAAKRNADYTVKSGRVIADAVEFAEQGNALEGSVLE